MPLKDIIHDAVKNALIKDGWTITADPFFIEYEDVDAYIDLEAERTLAAERNGKKIAVEIKTFNTPSLVHDLEVAIGQYTLYRSLLELSEAVHHLYLAVSKDVYRRFQERKGILTILQMNRVALLVVDIDQEEITQWNETPTTETTDS